jgi:hypothetical protein
MYLALVLPAAVVTLLKKDWLLLWLGVISFGFAWFIGAKLRAKPGSWWERNRYPKELVDDASGLASLRKKRRTRVLVITASILVLVGLFSARPTPILGVDSESLQYSVGGGGIVTFGDRCRPREDGSWTCFRYDNASSGDVPYRVEVNWSGCWQATYKGPREFRPEDQRLSGCVTVFDHIRLLNIVFP